MCTLDQPTRVGELLLFKQVAKECVGVGHLSMAELRNFHNLKILVNLLTCTMHPATQPFTLKKVEKEDVGVGHLSIWLGSAIFIILKSS